MKSFFNQPLLNPNHNIQSIKEEFEKNRVAWRIQKCITLLPKQLFQKVDPNYVPLWKLCDKHDLLGWYK